MAPLELKIEVFRRTPLVQGSIAWARPCQFHFLRAQFFATMCPSLYINIFGTFDFVHICGKCFEIF
jgi:hypothetical protein